MLSIDSPYSQYFETDGDPLDAGQVWFGVANLDPVTNPIPVFWDFAGTIPALQPISTRNGYLVRSGSPAIVYVAVDYSVTAKNRQGVIVYTLQNSAEFSNDAALQLGIDTLRADITDSSLGTKGPGMLKLNPTLSYASGSVGRSLASTRFWNCADYPWLAKFDGSTDDTAAILACWTALKNAGGGTLVLPGGTAKVTSLPFAWASIVTINIRGAGMGATVLQKTGGAASPVIAASNLTTVLDVNSEWSGFSVIGAGDNSHNGIALTNVGNLKVRDVLVTQCQIGIDNIGSLVLDFTNVILRLNTGNYRCAKANGVYPNAVRFFGGDNVLASARGIELNHTGSHTFWGTRVEGNGTAANTNTGAVAILTACAEETGLSVISFNGVHFEANKGENFLCQAQTSGSLYLTLNDVLLLASESGRALNIGAITSLTLLKVLAASPGDVVTTAALSSLVMSCAIATLTDTSTRHTYVNLARISGTTSFATTQKSSVAVTAAGSMTLPAGSGMGADVIVVNGTTTITSIDTAGNDGRTVTLIFTGALTVTDGANLNLQGNFVTTPSDTLTLACFSTAWYEVTRSPN